jgi:hypothetical protein
MARPACEALGSPKAVFVLFDEERRTLGLKGAKAGVCNAYRHRDEAVGTKARRFALKL